MAKLCPVGTRIQTLIFSKEKFSNKKDVKKWIHRNNFESDKIEENENSYRSRQIVPKYFDKETFRTITITDGVQAVIGCPRKRGTISRKKDGGNASGIQIQPVPQSLEEAGNAVFDRLQANIDRGSEIFAQGGDFEGTIPAVLPECTIEKMKRGGDLSHLDELYKKSNSIDMAMQDYAGELGIFNLYYGHKVDPVKRRKWSKGYEYLYKKYGTYAKEGAGIEDDLFEHIDRLPEPVQNLLQEYSNEEEGADTTGELLQKMETLGYTFDYGLDYIPVNLRPLTDEDYHKSEFMASGGEIISRIKEKYPNARAVKNPENPFVVQVSGDDVQKIRDEFGGNINSRGDLVIMLQNGGDLKPGSTVHFTQDGETMKGMLVEDRGDDVIVDMNLRELLVSKDRITHVSPRKKFLFFKEGGTNKENMITTTNMGSTYSFFTTINLQALPGNVADYIRQDILGDKDLNLVPVESDAMKEFISVIDKKYPQAIVTTPGEVVLPGAPVDTEKQQIIEAIEGLKTMMALETDEKAKQDMQEAIDGMELLI